MKTKSSFSITAARKNIFKIAKEVQKPGNYFTLTEKGRPKVILISAEEFESIMETMEIVTSPAILEKINIAKEEYNRDEIYTFKEVISKLQVNDKALKNKNNHQKEK